jgi:tetratricopeptide (TPR) repeat protein
MSALIGCATSGAVRSTSCRHPVSLQHDADASVRDGCYECLITARDTYERLSANCDSADLLQRLFDVQLLIVQRERELAIDDAASTAVAKQFAARLPRLAAASRYLSIVAAIRPDAEGTGDSPIPQASEEFIRAESAWLTESPSASLLADYLRVALECELRQPVLPDANAAAVPLLQYRQAVCGAAVNVPAMHQVRARVPAFHEAVLFSARAQLGPEASVDHREALRLLSVAQERLPHSAAVAYQVAAVASAAGQCDLAERYYSDTLRLRPNHESARLGRAICLSQRGHYDEAIADASVMIDAGARSSGEAFYWRAWSRYQTQSLSEARADIEKAKQANRTPRTLMLAGLIELDQSDFGLAHDDLTEAVSLNPAYCQARWQLGVVDFRRQDFEVSADAFAAAASCYANAIETARRDLATMAARTDIDGAFRLQRTSVLETESRELERGRDSAVLNAALNYARSGNRERAKTYLEQAGPNAPRDAVDEVTRALGVGRPSTP